MCDMATAETNDDPAATEKARDELQEAVPKAAATLTGLPAAAGERGHIQAAVAILDRAELSKAKAISYRAAQKEIGGGDTKDDDPLDDLMY